MALFPEKEPELPVSEIPETPEIPEYIKKGGVKTVPFQPTGVVRPAGGALPIQTPPGQPKSVQVPADAGTLVSWSKGPVASSLTWFGAFWLRIIKKALHFGWRIVRKEG